MINRASRRALVCALSTTTFLASPAFGQQVTSPTFRQLDGNGVDLVKGDLVTSITEGSIGSGSGEIKLLRMLGSNGSQGGSQWDGILLNYVSGQGTYVDFGTRHDAFPGAESRGASISGSGASYQYTAPDGTVIAFQNDMAGSNGETTSNLCMGGDTNCILYPSSITSPDGKTVSLTYDYWTHCYAQTPPGQPRSFDDPVHCDYVPRLKSVTNNEGYQVTFSYADARTGGNANPPASWSQKSGASFYNNAVSTTTAQASVSYSYPVSGETDITDMGGRVWRITSSSTSLAIRRPGAAADTTTYNLNNGQVTSATVEGVTTSYGRTVSGTTATMTVTDPLAHSKVITSDLNLGRPTSVTDELNHTTSFQYDANARLTRTTLPEGNYTQLTYDGRGNVTQTRQVAKAGSGLADIVTSASYDGTCTNAKTCNEPNSTTDANNNVTNYTYDGTHGGVLTVTAPAPSAGVVRPQTRYSYTLVNGVYRVTGISACQTTASCVGTSDETTTSFAYDVNANVTSEASSDGIGALNATATMTYDPMGNLLTVNGPLAGPADTTRYRYDPARELIGVTSPDPDGSGPLGMQASRNTYANGVLTRSEKGTVNSQSDADWSMFMPTQSVDITYDANGRPIWSKLSSGGVDYALSQASYDALGRLNCTAVRMNIAAYGSLPSDACTQGTAGSYGPDQITQNTYDAAGRLTQVQSGVGTSATAVDQKLSYTANGKIAYLTDGENNLTAYVYDGFDRLSKTYYPNPNKGALDSNGSDNQQLTYDANSNIIAKRNRDGTSISYAYDALNRVTSKTLPTSASGVAGYTIAYGYDLLGQQLSATFGMGGPGVTNTYDALGRLTSSSSNVDGTARTTNSTFDLAGNRTLLVVNVGGYSAPASYDLLNRLTANGGLIQIAYDNLGHRSTVNWGSSGTTSSASYSYDPVDRLASLSHDLAATSSDQSLGFSYTPASQITSRTSSNDSYAYSGLTNVNRNYSSNGLNQYTAAGSTTFTYDANGNLTSDGANTFMYDAENKLTSVSGAHTATLSYDPLGRLSQVSASSGTTRFIYDGDHEVVETDGSGNETRAFVWGPGADEPMVSWELGTGPRMLHADERGSVISVADSSGNVLATNSYDEYGTPGSANQGRFQYTGQAWLPEVGVYYYKARMYSPTMGRFLQSDPIGYNDGPNWYAYAHNDPVNRIDPSGLEWKEICHNELRVGTKSVGESTGPYPHVVTVCQMVDIPTGPIVPVPIVPTQTAGGTTLGSQPGNILVAQIKGERGKTAKPTGTGNPEKKYKPGPTPGTRIFTDPHTGKKTVKPWPDDPRLAGSNFSAPGSFAVNPWVSGGVVVGGAAIACAIVEPCGAAALGILGLGSLSLIGAN